MSDGLLAELLGSRAAEAALLHLYHHGETYGRAVAGDMGVSLLSVQRQLDKFERLGVLVSREVGRTRLYQWNPKSLIAKKVEELVKVSYEGMPLALRQSRFAARRRPRAKGKPVLSQQASESKTRR
jgi:DNA-binding transcriptional ArsR family regulator